MMGEGTLLNEDIHRNILSRLPARKLLQCKAVCKQWKSIISDLHFISEQAQLSCKPRENPEFFASIYVKSSTSFLWNTSAAGIPNELQGFLQKNAAEIVGSCNGLLLCWSYDGLSSSIMILNPTYMDYFILPDPIRDLSCMDQEPFADYSIETSIGLAFDPFDLSDKSFKYQAVLVESFTPSWQASHESVHDLKFQIYSSKTGSWCMSKETNRCYTISDASPVFYQGVLFWLCIRDHILCFDVEREKSWLMDLPPELKEEKTRSCSSWDEEWFGSSEGGLCFFRTSVTRLNVWTNNAGNSKNAKWFPQYSVCLQNLVENHFDLLSSIVKGASNSDEIVSRERRWKLQLKEMDVKIFHPLHFFSEDGRVLLRAGDGIFCYDAEKKSLNLCYSCAHINFVYVHPYKSNLITLSFFKRDEA